MQLPVSQADALQARARRLLYDHRARARKDGVVLDYGLHGLRQLLASSPCCAYCRQPVAFDAQIDHRTPIARGGRHALDNLAVASSSCNSIKGQLNEAEYDELLGVLTLLHPTARADLERRLLSGGRRYARRRRGDRPSTLR